MWEIKRNLDRGSILSGLVVAAFDKEPKPQKVKMKDLTNLLAKLIDVIDLPDFSISPNYSEDIARFVFNHCMSGYATSWNPIIFNPKGLDRCRSRILEAYQDKQKREELIKIAKVLNIDLDRYN
jgi:hypothetical protein